MSPTRAPRSSGRAAAVLAACVGLIVLACGAPTGVRNDPFGSPQASPPLAIEPGPGGTDVVPTGPARPVGATTGGAMPSAAAPAAPYVPAESRDVIEKRLAVVLDGRTIYIKNGGRVELGDGLAVEIYLDPYPPSTLSSTMDVYLTRDGRGVADGGVEMAFDMLAMAHGPFSAEAKKIGGGHYLISLEYIMFGPWDQEVTVRLGLRRIHLPILVVAYP